MAAEHHGLQLSRRHFVQGTGVAGLGLLAGCGRLPGQAASPAKVPRIGVLRTSNEAVQEGDEAFVQGLHDLGYVADYSIIIERRYANEQAARLPEQVAEL